MGFNSAFKVLSSSLRSFLHSPVTSHLLGPNIYIQGDQKVSVHLMITIQSSGALRLFDHPVYIYIYMCVCVCVCVCVCLYLYIYICTCDVNVSSTRSLDHTHLLHRNISHTFSSNSSKTWPQTRTNILSFLRLQAAFSSG